MRVRLLFMASIVGTSLLAADAAKKVQPTNCQVKLVKEASASSIEMDFFATSKEQCLKWSEPNVEATFKQGTIERRKRGAGPEQ